MKRTAKFETPAGSAKRQKVAEESAVTNKEIESFLEESEID